MKKTVIIAGITRSGMTLTMQMLDRGGYPVFGTYPAYEDVHPYGIVKGNEGKAIKIVDTHNYFPKTGDYHVILLRRNHEQQAKSIAKFLKHMGMSVNRDDAKALQKSIAPDWNKIYLWAKKQKSYMLLDFEYLIQHKLEAAIDIANFIGSPLNTGSMASVVLNRNAECTDFLYETLFV